MICESCGQTIPEEPKVDRHFGVGSSADAAKRGAEVIVEGSGVITSNPVIERNPQHVR